MVLVPLVGPSGSVATQCASTTSSNSDRLSIDACTPYPSDASRTAAALKVSRLRVNSVTISPSGVSQMGRPGHDLVTPFAYTNRRSHARICGPYSSSISFATSTMPGFEASCAPGRVGSPGRRARPWRRPGRQVRAVDGPPRG
jgi:hypothetical protein